MKNVYPNPWKNMKIIETCQPISKQPNYLLIKPIKNENVYLKDHRSFWITDFFDFM